MNKDEQKKEYTKPSMVMFEMKFNTHLLECSNCDDNNINVIFDK